MKKKVKIIISILVSLMVIGVAMKYSLFKDNSIEMSTIKNETLLQIENAFNANNIDQAILQSKELVDNNKDNIDALLVLSSSYLQKGSLDFKEEEYAKKGLELSDKILAINNDSYHGYFVEGYAYEIMQEYDEALKSYNKYLEFKEDAKIYNQIGHVYDLLGNNEKAEEFYFKSLALDPDFIGARMNIARTEFENGKYKEILDGLVFIYKNTNNNHLKAEAAYMIGMTNIMSEPMNAQEAEKYMVIAKEDDSKFPLAFVGMGQVMVIKGLSDSNDFEKNMEIAESNFNKAIDLNPNQTMAYLSKARLLAVTGNEELSSESYFKALDVVNSDITLMKDNQEKLKKEIKEEIEFYDFKRGDLVSFFQNFIYLQTTYAGLKSRYDSRAEAMAAINKFNSGLKSGEQGHRFIVKGSSASCANGGYITWSKPKPKSKPKPVIPTPPPCNTSVIKVVTDDSCTDGAWTTWNTTDESITTNEAVILPHSRIYIGTKKVTSTTGCGKISIKRLMCQMTQYDASPPVAGASTENISAE